MSAFSCFHIHHAVILGVARDLDGEICQYFIFGGHFGSHFKIGKISFQQDIITNKFQNPLSD